MQFLYNILLFLQSEMTRPKTFGLFHIICIVLCIFILIYLYKIKNKYNEKQLKNVLFIYGFIAFILELLKQIIWSFNYDVVTGVVNWDFEWYAFPFQLCSTPIYVSLICAFLKKNKLRDYLLSYLAYITILGGLITMIYPESCFVSDILINIHTMWLHGGSMIVSIYLLMNREVELSKVSLKKAFLIFIVFLLIAETLNISIYNSGILNGETFNMFYISPYFISSLPVFDMIQNSVPFIFYIKIYIIAIFLGSSIIYFIANVIKKLKKPNYD